jgi:hypothetical protein
MPGSLLDLAKKLEARAGVVGLKAHEQAQRKALAILSYLVRVTPVDTSRAVSNWQVTIGTPALTARGAFFAGAKGSTYDQSADTVMAFGRAMLEAKKPGEPIYITNVLPYIKYLDLGSSTSFPGGFLAGAKLIARLTK